MNESTNKPVAYCLHETDIYDFAGWLTTRKSVMKVGASSECGPMADAVGEYIKTFPERFCTDQQAVTESHNQKKDDSPKDEAFRMEHALRLALEALKIEDLACRYCDESTPEHIAKAITLIEQALEKRK